MKPSNLNRHLRTEICEYFNPSSPLELHQRLLQGTFIERRALEEERNQNKNIYYRRRGRARDVDPELWMEGEEHCGGILTSLSPTSTSFTIGTN